MRSLKDLLVEYKKLKKAIGHFNISDSNQLKAVALASKETNLPVLIGLSEGERAFFPISHARALIQEYQKEGCQLYLNADHTYTLEHIQEALNNNVDSIVVDGAHLSFEENVTLVKNAIEARGTGQTLIEGELGYIGKSSSVMETLPEGAVVTDEMMTTVEDLQLFIQETNIDIIAPAVGNIHGIVRTGQPKLNIERLKILSESSSIPLVLHGGSGSSDEEFTNAISVGVCIIHINTDIRVIYRNSLEKSLLDQQNEVTPYKLLAPLVEETARYVSQKAILFAGN